MAMSDRTSAYIQAEPTYLFLNSSMSDRASGTLCNLTYYFKSGNSRCNSPQAA